METSQIMSSNSLNGRDFESHDPPVLRDLDYNKIQRACHLPLASMTFESEDLVDKALEERYQLHCVMGDYSDYEYVVTAGYIVHNGVRIAEYKHEDDDFEFQPLDGQKDACAAMIDYALSFSKTGKDYI